MVWNLDGHLTILPCLFDKAMEGCKVRERVTFSKAYIHGEASLETRLQDTQTSISGWKSDSQSKLNRIRDTLPTILNDNSTIGLPIFLGDDHPRKLHGSVNFDWYWYIFNWVNKNITGYRFVMIYDFRVKNDIMALHQSSVRLLCITRYNFIY